MSTSLVPSSDDIILIDGSRTNVSTVVEESRLLKNITLNGSDYGVTDVTFLPFNTTKLIEKVSKQNATASYEALRKICGSVTLPSLHLRAPPSPPAPPPRPPPRWDTSCFNYNVTVN